MSDGGNFNSTAMSNSSFATPHHNQVATHPNQPIVSNFDDFVDMEISNTGDNPNSMFQTALPSLKLNTENKLNNDQLDMIQQ